ncbi:MAG: CBS domain-containing protein [Candidatus Bathyarchaeota archaeon]
MESVKRLEVGSLISPQVLVPSTMPVSKVVGVLKDLNVYEAFMEENGKIGMVTTRDILRGSNITTAKVSSLAFFVPKLSPRSTVGEAARLMIDYRIRSLPVVEDNNFVGEVRALSIINAIRESDFSKVETKNIMTGNPVTLSRDDLTSKARSLMVRRRIDHLPVLAEKKLCGILTSSHIVFDMFQATIERSLIIPDEQRKLEIPVRNLADSNPLTCRANDKIPLVLDEMIKQRATYSIVTLWEEVQGIITYRDYMKLVAGQLKLGDSPVYILGLPEDPFEAEMVKSKYMNAIKSLRKPFPFIEEAKAVIKTFAEGKKERHRYEVSISVVTPKRIFSYSETGWDLPQIFDAVTAKLKKMLAERPKRRGVHREEKHLQLAGEEEESEEG